MAYFKTCALALSLAATAFDTTAQKNAVNDTTYLIHCNKGAVQSFEMLTINRAATNMAAYRTNGNVWLNFSQDSFGVFEETTRQQVLGNTIYYQHDKEQIILNDAHKKLPTTSRTAVRVFCTQLVNVCGNKPHNTKSQSILTPKDPIQAAQYKKWMEIVSEIIRQNGEVKQQDDDAKIIPQKTDPAENLPAANKGIRFG